MIQLKPNLLHNSFIPLAFLKDCEETRGPETKQARGKRDVLAILQLTGNELSHNSSLG